MARWERSGTTRVGAYGVFDVLRHEVRREGGRARAIHTFETRDWCNVVPVTTDGSVVLVRLHRFGIDAPSIEIPGGLVDPGEAPIEAARRELLEESGFEAEAVVPLGVVHANPALQPTRLHMFLATDCRPHPDGQALEDLEDCEVLVATRAELDAMLGRGEISHALVWTALHAWMRHEAR
jgi:8-oxo-dGTP pyrophosphatase MutT (NUDIX family)